MNTLPIFLVIWKIFGDLGYSLVAEQLPTMCDSLILVSNTEKQK